MTSKALILLGLFAILLVVSEVSAIANGRPWPESEETVQPEGRGGYNAVSGYRGGGGYKGGRGGYKGGRYKGGKGGGGGGHGNSFHEKSFREASGRR